MPRSTIVRHSHLQTAGFILARCSRNVHLQERLLVSTRKQKQNYLRRRQKMDSGFRQLLLKFVFALHLRGFLRYGVLARLTIVYCYI